MRWLSLLLLTACPLRVPPNDPYGAQCAESGSPWASQSADF